MNFISNIKAGIFGYFLVCGPSVSWGIEPWESEFVKLYRQNNQLGDKYDSPVNSDHNWEQTTEKMKSLFTDNLKSRTPTAIKLNTISSNEENKLLENPGMSFYMPALNDQKLHGTLLTTASILSETLFKDQPITKNSLIDYNLGFHKNPHGANCVSAAEFSFVYNEDDFEAYFTLNNPITDFKSMPINIVSGVTRAKDLIFFTWYIHDQKFVYKNCDTDYKKQIAETIKIEKLKSAKNIDLRLRENNFLNYRKCIISEVKKDTKNKNELFKYIESHIRQFLGSKAKINIAESEPQAFNIRKVDYYSEMLGELK
jgi:hypothetical protein